MYRKTFFNKDNLRDKNLRSDFSERLRALRGEKGVSQEYVSTMLGLAKPTYGTYENFKYLPDADTIAQLADYFNVSADYLLGLSDSTYTERNENLFNFNFSSNSKDKLLDISKHKILAETFQMLLNNKDFSDFLMYIHTYLVFSGQLDSEAKESIKDAYSKAIKIDISLNPHVSPEAYLDGGIKIADIYNSMIINLLQNILKEIARKNKSYFKEKITRIAQMEESENR